MIFNIIDIDKKDMIVLSKLVEADGVKSKVYIHDTKLKIRLKEAGYLMLNPDGSAWGTKILKYLFPQIKNR